MLEKEPRVREQRKRYDSLAMSIAQAEKEAEPSYQVDVIPYLSYLKLKGFLSNGRRICCRELRGERSLIECKVMFGR